MSSPFGTQALTALLDPARLSQSDVTGSRPWGANVDQPSRCLLVSGWGAPLGILGERVFIT